MVTPQAPKLTIAVVSVKGGVGKTTLATNVAATAHLAGHRTTLLELDSQGSALDWYAARKEGSKLDGLSVARADRALTIARFRELTGGYDVAILDGPPGLSPITRAAVVACDVVLLPIRAGGFDWWALVHTLNELKVADETRAQLKLPRARRIVVMNAADDRTLLARRVQEGLAELGADVAVELAPVTIRSRVIFGLAALQGETAVTLAPESPAADDIRELWAALAESHLGRPGKRKNGGPHAHAA